MKVTLDKLTKRFGGFTAVNSFSAVLGDGELICLLGPSGCGKTTILNMLSGIIPVTEGHIYFDDTDVTALPPDRRGIGMVFQNYALYPHMTVLQNICFPLEIQRVSKAERRHRAEDIANLVHVGALLNRYPSELSGGQQQRVAIARALVKNPRLLLLDEPLSNLDARLRLEMREEIRRIQQKTGITAIFVTHDQEEAMSISDRIVLMREGILQQNDLPQALYNQPANRFVAEFLGNPPINSIEGVYNDGRFTLDDGSASMLIDKRFGQPEPQQKLCLSIRAESFMLGDDDDYDLECELTGLYEMGKEKIASLRFGSSQLRAYISADHDPKPGDILRIKLRGRGVFLFDGASGNRV